MTFILRLRIIGSSPTDEANGARNLRAFPALPLLLMVAVGSVEPQTEPVPRCYEGGIGSGARLRRVIFAGGRSDSDLAPEVLAALDRWLARVAPVSSRAQ